VYERFTDRARKAMCLANEAAVNRNAPFILTTHILYGVLKEGGGVACNVLRHVIGEPQTADMLRRVSEAMEEHDGVPKSGKLPQSDGGKRVVQYAIETAKEWGNNWVGTEHLLAGLLKAPSEGAFGVLDAHGVTLEKVAEGSRAVVADVKAKGDASSGKAAELLRAFAGDELLCVRVTLALATMPGNGTDWKALYAAHVGFLLGELDRLQPKADAPAVVGEVSKEKLP
jgi:ATP-dependent Clp protease ATP-binding subunit ClpC